MVENQELMGAQVNSTFYQYDVRGNCIGITDASGNQWTMELNSVSARIRTIHPDAGTWTYEFDAMGRMINRTDAKGQWLKHAYEEIGRAGF